MAMLVRYGALGRVGENFVGLLGLFEILFGFFISGISIRMMLHRQSTIAFLDVGLAKFVSGPATMFATFLAEGIDRRTIDGAVNGVGRSVKEAGDGLRRMQTGVLRNYALAILGGTVLLLAYMWTRVI